MVTTAVVGYISVFLKNLPLASFYACYLIGDYLFQKTLVEQVSDFSRHSADLRVGVGHVVRLILPCCCLHVSIFLIGTNLYVQRVHTCLSTPYF